MRNKEKGYKFLYLMAVFFLLFVCNTYSAVISIPTVYANPNDCISLEVKLTPYESEITTAVVAFTFEPSKVLIGCNTDEISVSNNSPLVYDSTGNVSDENTYLNESPVNISTGLKNLGVSYRVAIYPRGLFVIAIWGSTQKFPSGTLFTVPCKILKSAQPGETLLFFMPTKEVPVTLERTFPDNLDKQQNYVEQQPFYCSLSNISALPVPLTTKSGKIRINPYIEGEVDEEGEGNTEGIVSEGQKEGSNNDGEKEGGEGAEGGGSREAQNEGLNEGNSTEGDDVKESKIWCGCNKDKKTDKIPLSYSFDINFGIVVGLLILLKQT